jgi:hypothetical protein
MKGPAHVQPSLAGLNALIAYTQHFVLGYFQPSRRCRDSLSGQPDFETQSRRDGMKVAQDDSPGYAQANGRSPEGTAESRAPGHKRISFVSRLRRLADEVRGFVLAASALVLGNLRIWA